MFEVHYFQVKFVDTGKQLFGAKPLSVSWVILFFAISLLSTNFTLVSLFMPWRFMHTWTKRLVTALGWLNLPEAMLYDIFLHFSGKDFHNDGAPASRISREWPGCMIIKNVQFGKLLYSYCQGCTYESLAMMLGWFSIRHRISVLRNKGKWFVTLPFSSRQRYTYTAFGN